MKFNERLIKLRKEKGMSQEDLAEKINVSRQTVSKWELGTTTPEMEKLVQLARLFEISVDALISEEKDNIESASSKESSSSAEYVGVDEKYIPKGDGVSRQKHVKEDPETKKFVKGYIIFVIVVAALIVGTTTFVFINIFRGTNAFFNFGKDMINEASGAQTEITNLVVDNMNKVNSIDNSSKKSGEEISKNIQETYNEIKSKMGM